MSNPFTDHDWSFVIELCADISLCCGVNMYTDSIRWLHRGDLIYRFQEQQLRDKVHADLTTVTAEFRRGREP